MMRGSTTTSATSAPSVRRATLASSMISGAEAQRLRARFGGGGAVQRPLRGSAQWLVNRDAAAAAAATIAPDARPRLRASAKLARRSTFASATMAARRQPPPAATKPAATKPTATKLAAAAEDDNDNDDLEEVLLPPGAREEDDEAELVAALGLAAASGGRGRRRGAAASARPPEPADADWMSALERAAWATWHLSDAELMAAGADPAAVRAPAVLAAVRTRFLHNPNIMLNSNFDCGFAVDQDAFKRILRCNYGIRATYSPTSYPGMCCPFVLRQGVRLEPHLQPGRLDAADADLNFKSPAFARKYVKATFIVFRTGNAFLRGSFSKEVMEFVFRQFENILVAEYPNIATRFTKPDSKEHHAVVKTRVAYFSRQIGLGGGVNDADVNNASSSSESECEGESDESEQESDESESEEV